MRRQQTLRQEPEFRRFGFPNPQGMHVTLRFLGPTPASRVAELDEALGPVLCGFAPLELRVRGVGAFPSPARPRVLWANVEAISGDLALVRQAVEDTVVRLGFPREEKPFHAHITLARIKDALHQDLISRLGVSAAGPDFGSFAADSVTLWRSDLLPGGARYTGLATWPLKG